MESQNQQIPSWVNALFQQHAAQAEEWEYWLTAVLEQQNAELSQCLQDQEW
jgi:hypothetical protein